MLRVDKERLAELDIYLCQPNEQVREGMRAMMRAEGLRRARSFARLEDLLSAMRERSPILLSSRTILIPKSFRL